MVVGIDQAGERDEVAAVDDAAGFREACGAASDAADLAIGGVEIAAVGDLVFGVHQDQGMDVAYQEGGGGHYAVVHSTPLTRECRRGREPGYRRAHATTTSWWSGMGNLEEECPQEWMHGVEGVETEMIGRRRELKRLQE